MEEEVDNPVPGEEEGRVKRCICISSTCYTDTSMVSQKPAIEKGTILRFINIGSLRMSALSESELYYEL